MTPEAIAGLCVAIGGMAGCSFFGGFEMGAYSVNRVRLAVRLSRGDRRARLLREELVHPNRMLAACMIGNNASHSLVSLGVAMITVELVMSESAEMALNTAVVLPAVFLLGEVVPKDLYRQLADSWTYSSVGVFRVLRMVLSGLGLIHLVRGVGDFIGALLGIGANQEQSARTQLTALLQEGAGAGVISQEQVTLADRMLALAPAALSGCMIPWRQVTTLALSADPLAREAMLRKGVHRLVPVIDEAGRVVGQLDALDAALDPGATTTKLMQSVLLVTPSMSVSEAIVRIRQGRTDMAVVALSDGTPVGLVTLRDLAQPMLGRLPGW